MNGIRRSATSLLTCRSETPKCSATPSMSSNLGNLSCDNPSAPRTKISSITDKREQLSKRDKKSLARVRPPVATFGLDLTHVAS